MPRLFQHNEMLIIKQSCAVYFPTPAFSLTGARSSSLAMFLPGQMFQDLFFNNPSHLSPFPLHSSPGIKS